MIDVKKIRTEVLKLSQGELAERLGVDQATVSRWENGQEVPGPAGRLIGLLAGQSQSEGAA
jgi:DNA-binding transcriptional regulator YiaG